MQGNLEFSFSDLKCKLVINVADGKILGNIIDVIFFPQTGKILGFVVPGAKKSFFSKCENIFIPYSCVCKIGLDVILVELFVDTNPCPCPTKNKKLNNMINILDDKNNNPQNASEQKYEAPITDEDYKIEVIDPNIYPK